MSETARDELQRIGWREWVAMPALGIERIKAKVDTGARSSTLHAYQVETFQRRGREWVRFKVHPRQRSTEQVVEAEAELLTRRLVRDSGGRQSLRPVIQVEARLLGQVWPIELTLAGRDLMGFRMLLGRQALRRRFVVDPGRSYLGGRLKRKKKKKPGGASLPGMTGMIDA